MYIYAFCSQISLLLWRFQLSNTIWDCFLWFFVVFYFFLFFSFYQEGFIYMHINMCIYNDLFFNLMSSLASTEWCSTNSCTSDARLCSYCKILLLKCLQLYGLRKTQSFYISGTNKYIRNSQIPMVEPFPGNTLSNVYIIDSQLFKLPQEIRIYFE